MEPDERPPWGEPTPREIRERCLRIQAGWSDADRRKRSPYFAEAEKVEFPRMHEYEPGEAWA